MLNYIRLNWNSIKKHTLEHVYVPGHWCSLLVSEDPPI